MYDDNEPYEEMHNDTGNMHDDNEHRNADS